MTQISLYTIQSIDKHSLDGHIWLEEGELRADSDLSQSIVDSLLDVEWKIQDEDGEQTYTPEDGNLFLEKLVETINGESSYMWSVVEEEPESRTKHLPGKHDQLSHGGGSSLPRHPHLESGEIADLRPVGMGNTGAKRGKIGSTEVIVKHQRLENEMAAVVINHHLGNLVDIPPTVVRSTPDGKRMVQEFVHNAKLWGQTPIAERKSPAIAKQRADVKVFDTVLSNWDRHGANLLYQPESHRVIAIDHGHLFTGKDARPAGKASETGVKITADHRNRLMQFVDRRQQVTRDLRRLNFNDSIIDGVFHRANWLLT